jgi:hypothetical protein
MRMPIRIPVPVLACSSLTMRPMRSYAAFALFAAACAGAKRDPHAPEATVEHFTLRSPGGFEELAIEGERIYGPDVDVTRYDDTYRGNVRTLLVDLRVRENLIEGTVGNARTELHVQKLADGFGVRGLFGGRMGQFLMQSDRLEGRMGGRVLVLRRSENDPLVYRSVPGAGGLTQRGSTELTFPSTFLARPIEQQAALLAIFFGR